MTTRSSLRFLLFGVLVTAAYMLFVEPGPTQWLAYAAIGAMSVTAMFIGIHRNAPRRFGPWRVTAIGLMLFVAGDLFYGLYANVWHVEPPIASISDIFYLAGYLFLAAGCAGFVRGLGGRDHDALLDAGITAIAGALVVYAILADSAASTSLLDRIVVDAYPICDILLLGMLVRLALVPAVRSRALWLLMSGFGLLLVADVAFAVLQQTAAYQAAGLLDAVWLMSYVAFGAAALHPRMSQMTEPRTDDAAPLSWRRILLLGVALLVGPAIMVVHDSGSQDLGSMPIALASAALAVLVMWRIARTTRARQDAQTSLAFLALHDTLTGLPNRALLLDRLNVAIGRAERSDDAVAVIFLDLDGFKDVNDSLGHSAGDLLLVEAAQRLQQAVRPADTVARFGGDEFVILVEASSREAARAVAERIRATFNVPFPVAGHDVFVSASVGIALSKNCETPPELLLQHADAAMYRAKAAGPDRIAFFDSLMQESVTANLALSTDLHAALQRHEFLLYYQPVVDLGTGEMIGTEALLRWQHPSRGLVSPAEFIPMAESSGLIVPIGRWVLDTAFAQLAAWRSRGDAPGCNEIAVNVSAVQLVRPGFAREVAESLGRARLDPRLVVLEITEGVLLEDGEEALRAVRELKHLGVRIALDDFGTGYSSLTYLMRFPVDILKVDSSFVNGLGTDKDSSAIVSSVVALARTLNLTVVAEGVETAAQMQRLALMGCSQAQGYHIGRPGPPEAIDKIARAWARNRVGVEASLVAITSSLDKTYIGLPDERSYGLQEPMAPLAPLATHH